MTSAIVIYESLTGTTATAGAAIALELSSNGLPTTACPTQQIDMQALSEAELVIVGSWVDGLVFFGQRPGGAARLKALPAIEGKQAAVYCTYAINEGKTLESLSEIVANRGGQVIGGASLRRDRLEVGVAEFVDRLLGALDARPLAIGR